MRRHLAVIGLGLAGLFILPACDAPAPLPTRAVLAVVPPALTATATPLPTPAVTPTTTPEPSPTPVPSPTPTATPCTSPGRIETGSFNSPTGGQLAYRVYLPPCYGVNGRTYPTLYMLPGNDQTEAIWDDMGLDDAAETAIQNSQISPLMIVMPAGGWIALNSSGGPGSYETVIMEEFIPFIEEEYCAWPDAAGRAIGGLSRGGYWALEIAFRHSAQFTSVGGHSASLLDIAAGAEINPQYTALSNDLGDLRIYLDIGRMDGGIANTQKLHDDLTTSSIAHTWVLNEGGHDTAYWTAHLPEYLDWYMQPWLKTAVSPPPCTPK